MKHKVDEAFRQSMQDVLTDLAERGILEDTGERRRDQDGTIQIVWQLSAFGRTVAEHECRLGLTLEQAVERARWRHGPQ